MDWSYDLLTAAEQSLLRACSVFLGGFTLDALVHVADSPRAVVLDLLGSLVRKSLVLADQVDGATTRYHLLETVRLYGQEQVVAAGEGADRRQRHAHYFANSVRTTRDRAVSTWRIASGDNDPEPFDERDNVIGHSSGATITTISLTWECSHRRSPYSRASMTGAMARGDISAARTSSARCPRPTAGAT